MKILVFEKKNLIIFIALTLIIIVSAFYYFYNISSNNTKIIPVANEEKLVNNENNNTIFLTDEIKKKFATLSKNTEKVAYLTFDDGPTKRATPKILEILDEENIKASFFVIGKYVNKHPEIVKREYESGHYIANHGYNHNNSILYKNDESFISEIQQTDSEIAKAIGVENYCSHIFRFPNGFMSANYHNKKRHSVELLKSLDYIYVDWNCLNKDSESKLSQYQLLNNLKRSSKNKGTLIVLMHDTNDVNDTTAVLKDSIDYLKSQGYTFKNFYDILR